MSRFGHLAVTALLCCAVTACDSDRPARSDWADDWQSARTLVPTAAELDAGGQPLCDELVGAMRQQFAELDPPPFESLDDVVVSWVESAESLAFDCPRGDERGRRLTELETLAAEIDAGLASGDR